MLILTVALAHATTAAHALDPAGLAALSDRAVLGDVAEVETLYSRDQIWTVARLDLVGGGQAEVWIPGGCIEGLCMTVAGTPTVEPGERVFVYLKDNLPTSFAQGLFHVSSSGAAVRDTSGLAFGDGGYAKPAFTLSELTATVPGIAKAAR